MPDSFEGMVARTLREQAAKSRLTPRTLEQVRRQARRLVIGSLVSGGLTLAASLVALYLLR